jgi:hypothetical protein
MSKSHVPAKGEPGHRHEPEKGAEKVTEGAAGKAPGPQEALAQAEEAIARAGNLYDLQQGVLALCAVLAEVMGGK